MIGRGKEIQFSARQAGILALYEELDLAQAEIEKFIEGFAEQEAAVGD